MKIIGFNLTKILVEKDEVPRQNVKIDQNIDIQDISEEKLDITSGKTLKIKFSLQINYSENFAKIEFAGNLLILPEESEFEELMKSWNDKIIPDNIRIPLFNFIMNKCNVKALSLEDELSLPYHMPMPRLATKSQKENSKVDNNQTTEKSSE